MAQGPFSSSCHLTLSGLWHCNESFSEIYVYIYIFCQQHKQKKSSSINVSQNCYCVEASCIKLSSALSTLSAETQQFFQLKSLNEWICHDVKICFMTGRVQKHIRWHKNKSTKLCRKGKKMVQVFRTKMLFSGQNSQIMNNPVKILILP